ncbi:hypothetical protein BTHE68_56580 [Burkholderia sp. THE68]|uniref:hypothetical protein n=1 Tax=Burkholderia sp. THE68 TaxID=758782 RepID=UPI0013160A6B|nr:hypothetical protein [Burkholderia sp. THE68]BBU31924.1 hypothetical protein BTHE68_56580 [Burkholderia sp. THE68]
MAYNRTYSLQEVVDILNSSEHRLRPDLTSQNGPRGHAISMHTEERICMCARPPHNGAPAKLPEVDSTLLAGRTSLALLVHEALNSAPGQRELDTLNAPGVNSASIRSVILRQGRDLDVFTVYRPSKPGQTSFDWLSAARGDGCIVTIFVRVYKIPGSRDEAIHIQTAFPLDFATTIGESIARARPRPGSKLYTGSE